MKLILVSLFIFCLIGWGGPYENQEKVSDGNVVVVKKDDGTNKRYEPVPFIKPYDNVKTIDLEGVDFNADVVAVIDGFEVTNDLFKAHLVMYLGYMDVNRFVTAMLADYGKKVRLEKGVDPSEFELTEDQLDETIKAQKEAQEQFYKGSPKLSMEQYKKNIDMTMGWERFRDIMRSMAVFEKVFMPDIKKRPKDNKKQSVAGASDNKAIPDELDPNLPVVTNANGVKINRYIPEITWNLMSQRKLTHNSRDILNSQYKEGGKIMSLLKMQFSRTIKDALLRSLDVDYFYSGNLEPGVLIKIEDMELKTEDVYAVLKDKVNNADRMMALREIFVYKAMDRALNEAGCLLTPEEAEKAYREHEKQYEGSFFTVELLAQLYGYLNMECYKSVYARKAGFEKMIEDEKNDFNRIKRFYEKESRFHYEKGKVKLNAIFFGVYNQTTNVYRKDGYQWASSMGLEVMKRLEAGESFESLAKEYFNKDGVFSTYDFNLMDLRSLRQTFAESPKSALFSGFSMSEYVYYSARKGELVGPITNYASMMGNPTRQGVFIFKVVDKIGENPVGPYTKTMDNIKNDYSELKFGYWAQEALKGSKIELARKK